MAESFIRFVGAAKWQLRERTKTKFLRRSVGDRLFDEIEEACAFPEKSLTMEQPVQTRPEYHELDEKQRKSAEKTKVYKGKLFKLHWYETTLQGSSERLVTFWAINDLDEARPALIQLLLGDY